MFIGEAPGYKEDKLGEPFVGKSGQLLDYYINLYGWEKEHLYLTNIIKCKTPRNREPNSNEINNCKEYLIREINVVKPKILVLFGNTAISTITGYSNQVKKLAGKPFRYKNMIIMPMYHPSYIGINKEFITIYNEHWKLLYKLFSKVVPEYQFNPKYNGTINK
jgi:DNA polymerase